MTTDGSVRAPKKKSAVLGDHKRIGKRFLPPLAKLNFESVSYIELGIPELLWLALLNHHLGQQQAAEAAARIARVTVAFKPPQGSPPSWSASATVLGGLDEAFRPQALEALAELRDGVAEALGALTRQYPAFPLAFLSSASEAESRRGADLELLKEVLEPVFVKRGAEGIRMQAAGIYMAFVAEQLVVAKHTSLANFPAVASYPETEESRSVAASICAGVNLFLGMTIQAPGRTAWARSFWNRGLELEPVDAGLVDLLAQPEGPDAE